MFWFFHPDRYGWIGSFTTYTGSDKRGTGKMMRWMGHGRRIAFLERISGIHYLARFRSGRYLHRRAMERDCPQVRYTILVGMIAAAFIPLLFIHIKAYAVSSVQEPVYQSYTSIEIQPGDTLWSLADRNTSGTGVSILEYLKEVQRLNHMEDDQLISGAYLIIPRYHTVLADDQKHTEE